MMNKEQTIEAIMKEYGKHGIQRELVALIYDLGVEKKVPQEMIYPGIRFQLNQKLGVNDTNVSEDVGSALFDASLRKVKEENPDSTDKQIATGIDMVGMDYLKESMDEFSYPPFEEIVEKALSETERFVESNS